MKNTGSIIVSCAAIRDAYKECFGVALPGDLPYSIGGQKIVDKLGREAGHALLLKHDELNKQQQLALQRLRKMADKF